METQPCPKCNAKMILRFIGLCYPTLPAQYLQEWKCGCGYKEEGPIYWEKSEEEIFKEKWQNAQKNNHKPIDASIKIKLIHSNAKVPTKATEHAAGYDLYAVEDIELIPHIFLHSFEGNDGVEPHDYLHYHYPTLVKLGFQLEIPIGYEAQIRPRSGLALKANITCANSPGTIDSDYRGEVGVILINHGANPYLIKAGDRIAQMIIAKVPISEFVRVGELESTQRSEGGYGHSGK